MTMYPSSAHTITQALRQGVVATERLDELAVGLEPLLGVVESELKHVAMGAGTSKWIRGDYGGGKTFATRLMCQRARALGFATSEIQISVNDTPLHRPEDVYRRLVARLTTQAHGPSALNAVADAWVDGLAEPLEPHSPSNRHRDLLDPIAAVAPSLATALGHFRQARRDDDPVFAQALLGWMAGQPHIGRRAMAKAGIRGSIDGAGALASLRGLTMLLRQTGHAGLVVVLDEVETLQLLPAHLREKSLNALRQLMDMLAGGQLPGLYLVVTGTPQFYDGYKGIKGLSPLSQRLETTFASNPRADNLRAAQVRLPKFDAERLVLLGRRARALFPADDPYRLAATVDDAFIERLAANMTERFGSALEVVPRLFLKTFIDICDRCDQDAAFDPYRAFDVASTHTPKRVPPRSKRRRHLDPLNTIRGPSPRHPAEATL